MTAVVVIDKTLSLADLQSKIEGGVKREELMVFIGVKNVSVPNLKKLVSNLSAKWGVSCIPGPRQIELRINPLAA